MKILFLAALLLAPATAFAQTETPPSAFDWKISPPEGSRYEMRYFSRLKSTTIAPEGTRKIKAEGTQQFRFAADVDVLPPRRADHSRWKITYRDFAMAQTGSVDGKKVEMPADYVREMKKLQDAYLKGLRGLSFTMELNARGDATAIEGLEAAREKIVRSATRIAPGSEAEMRQMVNASFTEKSLRDTFGKMGGAIPHFPVRAGESWTYQSNLPVESLLNFPIDVPVRVSGTRKLNALSPEAALLSDRANLTFVTNYRPEPTSPPLQFDFRGILAATMRVETATGMPLEWNTTQRMSGTVSGQDPGKPRQSAPMWTVVESRVVMERK